MDKNKQNPIRSNSTSSNPRGKSQSSSNQKKIVRKNKSKVPTDSIYLTEYMKQIILPSGDDFCCCICVDKPKMKKKNVYRHIIESTTHKNSICKKVDIEGHEGLIPKIQEVMTENKRRYSKKTVGDKEEKKNYLKFLIFCQSENLSFQQIASLGKFLHEMAMEKKLDFFTKNNFDREEISLIARCYGKHLLTKLADDLRSSPYSFTIDSSTVSRTNITSIKVRYLKEHCDSNGIKKTKIENRTIGIKYLKHSSTAKTMLDITNEKLLNLSLEVKSNLVGYVHDHASNLSGVHQGLGVLLKSDVNKFLVDIKDPCHSINLALYQSFEILPTEIKRFIKKIHNHFISPQRIAYLHNLQLDNNFKVLSPKHYVQTRWLSLGQSLERILEIWESLVCYMKLKPKFQGVTNAQYEEFISLLENKTFKLKIVFITGIFGKFNEMNILFQSQNLEIQNLLTGMQHMIKEFARLIIRTNYIPKDVKAFKEEEWDNLENYSSKFLSHHEFISVLITDVDKNLLPLESLDEEEKLKFANDFQPFIAKALNRLIYYFPFTDELINTLDFVTLNQEPDELKKKILTFNKTLEIIPFEKINELVKEINQLNEENLVLLKKEAKKSALFLWDLVKQLSDQEDEGSGYKLLDKLFLTAHALPTSSAGVEQSFSYIKLIKSAIRNRLHEDTLQSLVMISEEHRDKNIVISDEVIELLEEEKERLNKRKNPEKEELIHILLGKETQNYEIIQNNKMEDEYRNMKKQRESQRIEKEDFKLLKMNPKDEIEDIIISGSDFNESEIDQEELKDNDSIESDDNLFS